jgi:hydroxymethylglutaryl-CoA reductase
MLGNPRAKELAEIVVAVGLAQNLGALKALSSEGIQRGHMRMHARNFAVEAGATLEEIPLVVNMLCESQLFSTTKAKELLATIRQ